MTFRACFGSSSRRSRTCITCRFLRSPPSPCSGCSLTGLEMSESSRTWLNGSSFTGVMTASSMSVAADGNRAGATIDRDGVFRSTSG